METIGGSAAKILKMQALGNFMIRSLDKIYHTYRISLLVEDLIVDCFKAEAQEVLGTYGLGHLKLQLIVRLLVPFNPKGPRFSEVHLNSK